MLQETMWSLVNEMSTKIETKNSVEKKTTTTSERRRRKRRKKKAEWKKWKFTHQSANCAIIMLLTHQHHLKTTLCDKSKCIHFCTQINWIKIISLPQLDVCFLLTVFCSLSFWFNSPRNHSHFLVPCVWNIFRLFNSMVEIERARKPGDIVAQRQPKPSREMGVFEKSTFGLHIIECDALVRWMY